MVNGQHLPSPPLLGGLPEALPTCVCVTASRKSIRGQRLFRSPRKGGQLFWIEVSRDAITLQKL